MTWRFRNGTRASTLLGTVLTVLSIQGPAAAEDEDQQSTCATAAEQAQMLRLGHRLLEARNELLVCAQSSCPIVVSTDCVRWLSEVERAVPSVVIKATGPFEQELIRVSVWVDGAKAFDELDGLARSVNPGVHRFRFEAEGMIPVEQQVVVREGEARRMLAVKFKAVKPKPSPNATAMGRATPVLPMVLAGVGMVALGSFAYFGINGRAEASELAKGCGATKTCEQSQIDPIRTKLILADVSLGVSLVSLGIATYLFVSEGRTRPKENATVQIGAGPGAGSVKLGLSF